MTFQDIITLLVGTAEADANPKQLVDTCFKYKMCHIDYINWNNDPLFSVGYAFVLDINDVPARLEIIETNGKLLQSGFQIIYKPQFLNFKNKKDFNVLRKLLNDYYQNESHQDINGTDLYNFANDISQCYLSKAKVEGK